MRFDTFEEFSADWRETEKLQKDSDIKVTCICGQHDLTIQPLTDDELFDLYNVLKGLPPEPKPFTLKDIGL